MSDTASGGKHEALEVFFFFEKLSADISSAFVCLFAPRCPLDAELSKCKRWWVIVHNTAHEVLNLMLFSSMSNNHVLFLRIS